MEKSKKVSCYVFGLGSLLKICTEHLINHSNIEILGFISADGNAIDWAQKMGLNTLYLQNKVAYSASQDAIESFLLDKEFDYLFSIVNAMKLPTHIIELPSKAAINFHDSELPKYAGVDATTWAIMRGEDQHAVTWHLMTRDIDEGAVVKQLLFPIEPDETAFSLNGKCFEAGIQSFRELIDDIENGRQSLSKQDPSKRSYFSRFKPYFDEEMDWNHGIINWNDSAHNIDALVRSLNFGPYRNSMLTAKIKVGQQYYILPEVHISEQQSDLEAGTIVTATADAITIATISQDLIIRNLYTIDGRSVSLADLLQRNDLVPNTQLSSTSDYSREIHSLDRKGMWHEIFWAEELSRLPGSVMENKPADQLNRPYQSYPLTIPGILFSADTMLRMKELFIAYSLFTNLVQSGSNHAVWLHHSDAHRAFNYHYELFSNFIPCRFPVEKDESVQSYFSHAGEKLEQLVNKGSFFIDIFFRYPVLAKHQGWSGLHEFGCQINTSGSYAGENDMPALPRFKQWLEITEQKDGGISAMLHADLNYYESTEMLHFKTLFEQFLNQIASGETATVAMAEEFLRDAGAVPGNNHKGGVSNGSSADDMSPSSAMELTDANQALLHDMFCNVLMTENIHLDENFFDRGDSLAAIRLIHSVNETRQLNLPLSIIYKKPTIRELAAVL